MMLEWLQIRNSRQKNRSIIQEHVQELPRQARLEAMAYAYYDGFTGLQLLYRFQCGGTLQFARILTP